MRNENELLAVQSNMWEGTRSKTRVTVPETEKKPLQGSWRELFYGGKLMQKMLWSYCVLTDQFGAFDRTCPLHAAQTVLGSSGLMSQIPWGRVQNTLSNTTGNAHLKPFVLSSVPLWSGVLKQAFLILSTNPLFITLTMLWNCFCPPCWVQAAPG